MSGGHAFLPPSGAAAWVACPAWPSMTARYPQDDTPESMEGTAAHWVFEQTFAGQQTAFGQVAPNGIVLTEEMLDGGDVYVETIDQDLARCGLDRSVLHVEQRVAMPEIHALNSGTPDTWFYAPSAHTLYEYDYKFGHDFVDAFQNWQLVDYEAGIIDVLAHMWGQPPAEFDQHLWVEFVVVQPRNYDRAGPVRRWRVKACDLRAMHNRLRSAAERAVVPEPVAQPGDQCEHCPGRHACNALQREGYRAAAKAGSSVPVELPPAALATELRMLRSAQVMLKARVTGLEEETFARVRRGESVPGFGMEPTFGREGWSQPAGAVIAMGQMLGKDISKPGVLTPKQAIKAGMPEALVKSMTTQESKGLKLVEVDSTAAAKVFGITS